MKKKGGHHFYGGRKLSHLEILEIFDQGLYSCDLEGGVVYCRWGRPLKPYFGNADKHLYVRIHGKGKMLAIALHRLVWIVGSRREIPGGWHVHHINHDVADCSFSNLLCLCPKDHLKFHRGPVVDDIPF